EEQVAGLHEPTEASGEPPGDAEPGKRKSCLLGDELEDFTRRGALGSRDVERLIAVERVRGGREDESLRDVVLGDESEAMTPVIDPRNQPRAEPWNQSGHEPQGIARAHEM